MVWHELQAQGEIVAFGGQTIEDLITNHYWSEKHRQMSVEAGYTLREIINHDVDLPTFTQNAENMNRYPYKQLSKNQI